MGAEIWVAKVEWTGERITALKRMWADGFSSVQIARELGGFAGYSDGGRSAVIGKLTRLGLMGTNRNNRPAPKQSRWTDERVGKLTQLWHDGLSVSQIAKELDVGLNAAKSKLRRLGLTGSDRPPPQFRAGQNNSNPVVSPATGAAPHPPVLLSNGGAATDAVGALDRSRSRSRARLGISQAVGTGRIASHRKRAGDAFRTLHRIKRDLKEAGRPLIVGDGITDLPDEHVPAAQRCTLLDLTDARCRWPCGDPREPGFFFCGAPSPEGSPYCKRHHAVAYLGPRPPVSTWGIWR